MRRMKFLKIAFCTLINHVKIIESEGIASTSIAEKYFLVLRKVRGCYIGTKKYTLKISMNKHDHTFLIADPLSNANMVLCTSYKSNDEKIIMRIWIQKCLRDRKFQTILICLCIMVLSFLHIHVKLKIKRFK